MFENIANAARKVATQAKAMDIGTIGKVVAGVLIFAGSAALTVAGANVSKAGVGEGYDYIPGDEEPVKVPAVEEPESE